MGWREELRDGEAGEGAAVAVAGEDGAAEEALNAAGANRALDLGRAPRKEEGWDGGSDGRGSLADGIGAVLEMDSWRASASAAMASLSLMNCSQTCSSSWPRFCRPTTPRRWWSGSREAKLQPFMATAEGVRPICWARVMMSGLCWVSLPKGV